jgi:homocysteine S-methyltransferase
MANEVPGVTVPDSLVERMRRAPNAAAAAAEGVQVAREIVKAITGMAAGVQISTPSGRLDAALDVLDVV